MFRTLRAILAQKTRVDDLERRLEALTGDLRRREIAVEELRSVVEFLQADMTKLRGRVTGGLRKEAKEEPQPPMQEDVNEMIRQGRFPNRRRV